MPDQRTETIRSAVRERYAKVAVREAGCGSVATSCCGNPKTDAHSRNLGYSPDEVANAPEGSNLGLGCGNPQAIAGLKTGETVVDLGSGGGFDCFLAARQVGATGRVIGVDMTPEMITKARNNADKGGYANVEFRLGEIEHMPVADGSVDVIISNCVVNLSPDKPQVYRDAFRVLKPGGRIAISDIAVTAELPREIREDLELYAGCVAGADRVAVMERTVTEAGFQNVRITPRDESRAIVREWRPGGKLQDYLLSVNVEAEKPRK